MRFITCILLLALSSIQLKAKNSKAVVGMWFSEKKDAKIQIYESNGKFYGKLFWLKEPYEADGKTLKTDTKNKDSKKRNRSILNLVILSDFVFEKDKWTNGQIYDPESGNTYKSELKLNGNKLDVRGYIGTPLFGRTSTFSRAD